MKPIYWRDAARRDLDDAAAWYAQQGGFPLETRFIAAVEATSSILREHPAAGSTRHAEDVPGLPTPLRFFPVRDFERYLLYYLDLPAHVEVLRVWNAARGLEALMEDAP
ncbi:MAG: type II toxin-antitoxin system RelE/ParE family toxin [Xanthomonadaceae bacterium]|nr:type II toxin-antitoxin system RelE/ParE family toxin [Xanthomonadaceae bacterium]